MTEFWIQAIGVGIFVLIALFAMSRMKSPSKGGDAAGAVIEEIQKTFDPRVKEIRQAERKMTQEKKTRKAGDDKDRPAGDQTLSSS